MTRTSTDDIDEKGTVRNGFDYNLQCWVKNYECMPCAHPLFMREQRGVCCTQMKYAGLDIRTIPGRSREETAKNRILRESTEAIHAVHCL